MGHATISVMEHTDMARVIRYGGYSHMPYTVMAYIAMALYSYGFALWNFKEGTFAAAPVQVDVRQLMLDGLVQRLRHPKKKTLLDSGCTYIGRAWSWWPMAQLQEVCALSQGAGDIASAALLSLLVFHLM